MTFAFGLFQKISLKTSADNKNLSLPDFYYQSVVATLQPRKREGMAPAWMTHRLEVHV